MATPGSLDPHGNPRLDATVAPWLLGCFGKGTLRTDPSAFPTLAPRDPALASRHALAPPPYVFAVPQIHANSPGLAHARGKHELPGWFKRALLHTRFVQSKDANGAVGDVVLVEGPQPAGRDFCASSGIVHYAVPQSRHAKYRAVLEQISDATMWSTGEGKHEERGVDVQSSADIWLLSIIRYFYLQDFVHAAGVDRLIYLDWDTVVYISAPAAWRILAAASPPIHMAAGSAYPPYGTANNIYTAWTNESLADYVGYIATHVSLQIPAECGRKATNGSALGLVNSYSDCLQLFWCKCTCPSNRFLVESRTHTRCRAQPPAAKKHPFRLRYLWQMRCIRIATQCAHRTSSRPASTWTGYGRCRRRAHGPHPKPRCSFTSGRGGGDGSGLPGGARRARTPMSRATSRCGGTSHPPRRPLARASLYGRSGHQRTGFSTSTSPSATGTCSPTRRSRARGAVARCTRAFEASSSG